MQADISQHWTGAVGSNTSLTPILVVSDGENPNLFVTAGHEGLKLWDVRWLVISFDDGTMRILSLTKAANDVPVTGGPFAGPKYQDLHGFTCSAFAIWSVQVSQTTVWNNWLS
ncbi:uncharacterized protein LOC109719217 [Ananas comosus]|uniref:Uncharacterized protein LOC109719217 n=1 Tax=Ananas comosus TaxID=4615 RepID=A0A6P5FZ63_ANACO|nr:uncharacterized protein LOC109719217 [Ananas comosus]